MSSANRLRAERADVDIHLSVNSRDSVGESPIWCDRTLKLWWVDIYGPCLQSFDPSTGRHEVVPVPGKMLGSFGLCQSGRFVLAMEDGLYVFDPASGRRELVATVAETGKPNNRLADGKCDPLGRYWAGTMNEVAREPDGALYCIAANGSSTRILQSIIVPNAACFSPDGRIFYFADSRRFTIWAFDFDLDSGRVSKQRVFRDTTGHPGRPDGAVVDTDGCVWTAEYVGGRLVRYTPAGEIDRVIELPVSHPTSCAFGGNDMKTLFVTSATRPLSADALAAEKFAGSLLAIDVHVGGFPERRFAA